MLDVTEAQERVDRWTRSWFLDRVIALDQDSRVVLRHDLSPAIVHSLLDYDDV